MRFDQPKQHAGSFSHLATVYHQAVPVVLHLARTCKPPTCPATRPLTSPFLTGTSDNRESWWPHTGWDALGYQPADGADHLHPEPRPLPDDFMGGAFADDELPT